MVAVAGTHGKTTTTSLLTVALAALRRRPVVRHRRRAHRDRLATPHDGTGELFVAEADESDGAFLVYSPVRRAWSPTSRPTTSTTRAPRRPTARPSTTFLDRIDPDGFLVVVRRRPRRRRPGRRRPAAAGLTVVGVGESERRRRARRATCASSAPTSTFTVVDRGRRLGEVTLQIPGRHYVLDALAALAAGLRLGFAVRRPARAGSRPFTGTRRRMELKGEAGGVRVYDSYAHHPNEIAGDLQAARVAGRGGPGAWSPSSRTWSRAPGSSAPRWARRSAPPTRSW